MANEWIREICVRRPLMRPLEGPDGEESYKPVRKDYALVSEKTGAKVAETNLSGKYCQACFKEFRSGFRSLDANGNCRIHGGQFGQNFGMTKTKQTVAKAGLFGAAALLLLGAMSKKDE